MATGKTIVTNITMIAIPVITGSLIVIFILGGAEPITYKRFETESI